MEGSCDSQEVVVDQGMEVDYVIAQASAAAGCLFIVWLEQNPEK